MELSSAGFRLRESVRDEWSMAGQQFNWRAALVIVLSMGGALLGGVWGAMIAAFAGDASPSEFAMNCFVASWVAGAASLGALPGLIVGLLLGLTRLKWLLGPAVGTGLGTLLGAFLGEMGSSINLHGFVQAAGTLAGAALGCLPIALDLVGRYGGE
jgi:hypothetical protein